MVTRQQALKNLIACDQTVQKLVDDLRVFGWDSDRALIILTRADMALILNRYSKNTLDGGELEAWANAIEGREDIDYEPGYEAPISEIIHQLANPLLTQPISPLTVERLLKMLTPA